MLCPVVPDVCSRTKLHLTKVKPSQFSVDLQFHWSNRNELGKCKRFRYSLFMFFAFNTIAGDLKFSPTAVHNVNKSGKAEFSLLFNSLVLLARGERNAILPSRSLLFYCPSYREKDFWQQNDVTSQYHVVFWPRDSNTIFQGKIAPLGRVVKSWILNLDCSNFGIVDF